MVQGPAPSFWQHRLCLIHRSCCFLSWNISRQLLLGALAAAFLFVNKSLRLAGTWSCSLLPALSCPAKNLYIFLSDYSFIGGDSFFIGTAIKFMLAAVLLFPPTFLMGGTFPAISQFLIRENHEIGTKSSLIYAINTTGAVLGAALTGIAIPFWLGYHTTYFLVFCATTLVGITALISGNFGGMTFQESVQKNEKMTKGPARFYLFLAFWSGFLALCFEILWTRYFAQYMENSVYTFSAILTTYLLALAAGAFFAHALQKKQQLSEQTIFYQLIAAGLLNLAALLLFPFILDSPDLLDAASWSAYYGKTYFLTVCFIFIPGVMTGVLFPSLLRFAGTLFNLPAPAVGSLYSINIIGSIIGSLVAGFILIQLLGVSISLILLSFLYFLTALALIKVFHLPQRGKATLLLLVALLLSSGAAFSLNNQSRASGTTQLLETIEGSHAPSPLLMKVVISE